MVSSLEFRVLGFEFMSQALVLGTLFVAFLRIGLEQI
jgi:hypothetical protein